MVLPPWALANVLILVEWVDARTCQCAIKKNCSRALILTLLSSIAFCMHPVLHAVPEGMPLKMTSTNPGWNRPQHQNNICHKERVLYMGIAQDMQTKRHNMILAPLTRKKHKCKLVLNEHITFYTTKPQNHLWICRHHFRRCYNLRKQDKLSKVKYMRASNLCEIQDCIMHMRYIRLINLNYKP